MDIDEMIKNAFPKSGTAKENIQLPQIVFLSFINYDQALRDPLVNRDMLVEIAMSIASLIPTVFKDEKYKDDMKKAGHIERFDVRPESCGVKLNADFCKENGYPLYKDYWIRNHHKIKQAIADLIQRRGLGFKFENKHSPKTEDLPE